MASPKSTDLPYQKASEKWTPNERQRGFYQAILGRIARREEVGTFSDGEQIDMVIDGGGTAGAAGAGIMTAYIHTYLIMDELKKNGGDLRKAYDKVFREDMHNPAELAESARGKVTCFDSFTTCSSGTCTGIYGQAGNPEGTRIYYEDLPSPPGDPNMPEHTRQFMHTGRGFASLGAELCLRTLGLLGLPLNMENPVPAGMDLPYMSAALRGASDPVKAYSPEAVLSNKTPLRVVLVDLDKRERFVVEDFEHDPVVLHKIMELACLIPGVAGTKVPGAENIVKGREGARLVDGSFGGNCPIDEAPKGSTHCLVVRSVPEDASPFKEGADKYVEKTIRAFVAGMAKNPKEAWHLFRYSEAANHENNEAVLEAMNDPRYVFMGLPKGSPQVSSACADGKLLRNVAWSSYRNQMIQMFNWMHELGFVDKASFDRRFEKHQVRMPPSWQHATWFSKKSPKAAAAPKARRSIPTPR